MKAILVVVRNVWKARYFSMVLKSQILATIVALLIFSWATPLDLIGDKQVWLLLFSMALAVAVGLVAAGRSNDFTVASVSTAFAALAVVAAVKLWAPDAMFLSEAQDESDMAVYIAALAIIICVCGVAVAVQVANKAWISKRTALVSYAAQFAAITLIIARW